VYAASVPTVKDTTAEAPDVTVTLPTEAPSTDTA
jgi:hypothetical protein